MRQLIPPIHLGFGCMRLSFGFGLATEKTLAKKQMPQIHGDSTMDCRILILGTSGLRVSNRRAWRRHMAQSGLAPNLE